MLRARACAHRGVCVAARACVYHRGGVAARARICTQRTVSRCARAYTSRGVCFAARAHVYHGGRGVAARAHVHTGECVLLCARMCITGEGVLLRACVLTLGARDRSQAGLALVGHRNLLQSKHLPWELFICNLTKCQNNFYIFKVQYPVDVGMSRTFNFWFL